MLWKTEYALLWRIFIAMETKPSSDISEFHTEIWYM